MSLRGAVKRRLQPRPGLRAALIMVLVAAAGVSAGCGISTGAPLALGAAVLFAACALAVATIH
ncbi:MAG: hypothetical protein QHJ34_06370 [bacterium]|nr:hypothetical protein [candidate division KSB1 bacterium]MDH7559846.1 hypothetical protein [bacterium]